MAWRLHQNKSLRDFPGGPVVRTTLPPQEAWVPSLVREPRSHLLQGMAKKKERDKIRD